DVEQKEFLMARIDTELSPLGFTSATPRDAAGRGGHVAIGHPDGWRLCQALRGAGVIPDFRPPDIIRLAPSPLYTSFVECAEAVARLKQVTLTRACESFSAAPAL